MSTCKRYAAHQVYGHIVSLAGGPWLGHARPKERDWMEALTILDQFTHSLRAHCAERLPSLLHGHRDFQACGSGCMTLPSGQFQLHR